MSKKADTQRFHEERNTLLKYVLTQFQKQNKLVLLPNATIADLQLDSLIITNELLEGSSLTFTDEKLYSNLNFVAPRKSSTPTPPTPPTIVTTPPTEDPWYSRKNLGNLLKITTDYIETAIDSADSSPSDLLDAKGRILHQKIRCNGCGSEPLAGNRFKCLNCPDFNLCERCDKQLSSLHPTNHIFLKIHIPLIQKKKFNNYCFPAPVTIDGFEHVGVICSGCGQCPIIGTRYRCWYCDVEFCQRCEKRFGGSHDPDHFFMSITKPLSHIAHLPAVTEVQGLIEPVADLVRSPSVEEALNKSAKQLEVPSVSGSRRPSMLDVDQDMHLSQLWPTPKEFVKASYELLLLCTNMCKNLKSAEEMFAVSQMRHKMTIGDKEDKDMKSNLMTESKIEFMTSLEYRFHLLKTHYSLKRFQGTPKEFLVWQRRQVAIFYSGLRATMTAANLKSVTINKVEMLRSEVFAKMEKFLMSIIEETRKQLLVEEDEPLLEDDEYDNEKTSSYHSEVSINDLLLEFEQQFLDPILTSLNMGNARGTPLSYPYIFATEIYEILCVATYFDSTGMYTELPAQRSLLSPVQKSLGLSDSAHKVSLFRVTLKTYTEYPRAELPQILWSIVQSQLEADPYESSVLYNPVPDNANERNYQFTVYSEADEWFHDPKTFMVTPALPEIILYLSIHYHIQKWFQLYDTDTHDLLTNEPKPIDRTCIEPLMRGYYSLLSQQYGSQSDYLGSIPTFIKFLKKYEDHVDQVIKMLRKNQIPSEMLKAVVEELASLLMSDVSVMCDVKNGKKNAILRALTSYPSYLVDLKNAFEHLRSFLSTFDSEKNIPAYISLVSPVISDFDLQTEDLLTDGIVQSLRGEEWKPIASETRHSSSIQDLFEAVHRLLPFVYAISNEELKDVREFFAGTMIACINRTTLKYIQSVLESCGNIDEFLPPKLSVIPPEDKYGLLKLQSAVKKEPAIQPIPGHVWNRLTRQRLEQLCVRINNFYFAHLQMEKIKLEFKGKMGEGWDNRFDLGDTAIINGVASLINYTAAKMVFFDLRTPFIEELYVPSASKARIDRMFRIFDPIFNSCLKSLVYDERITKDLFYATYKNIIQAMEFILIFGGADRNFEMQDAELIAEDLLALRQAFTGKRKTMYEVPILPDALVLPLLDPLKNLVNNIMGLSSENLIKQYEEAPILVNSEPDHPLLRWITKWNLLSIMIHRNDKEAKKWVNTKRETTIYTYLKKGQKQEFAERIEKAKQQQASQDNLNASNK